MMLSSEYLLLESSGPSWNIVFVAKYQILVSLFTFFENKGISYNTCSCVYHVLVMNCCIKDRKLKRLDASYLVELWRFKMFLQSFVYPYLIDATSCVNCFAVLLKTLLDMCKQLHHLEFIGINPN